MSTGVCCERLSPLYLYSQGRTGSWNRSGHPSTGEVTTLTGSTLLAIVSCNLVVTRPVHRALHNCQTALNTLHQEHRSCLNIKWVFSVYIIMWNSESQLRTSQATWTFSIIKRSRHCRRTWRAVLRNAFLCCKRRYIICLLTWYVCGVPPPISSSNVCDWLRRCVLQTENSPSLLYV